MAKPDLYMKGDITIKLLEHIEDFSGGIADHIVAFLTAGYGASMNRLEFERNKLSRAREWKKQLRREKDKYYKLLYKLKNDGLVVERKNNDESGLLRLTSAGRRRLLALRKQRAEALPAIDYKKEGGRFVVVAFDIPEEDRNKRRWLRAALSRIGLQMIQKSVWVGKVKIPKDLLEDLSDLKIIEHVEILEINKAGSLKLLN